MHQRPEHLSDDEIQRCADSGPGECPQSTETHLAECEFCLNRLLRWQKPKFEHLAKQGMREEPYRDCPGEDVLRNVAAEISSPEIADSVLQHASLCNHCGPLLKQYLEIFSEELSPEIESMIAGLPSASREAHKRSAREIARSLRSRLAPGVRGRLLALWNQIFTHPGVAWKRVVAVGAAVAVTATAVTLGAPPLWARYELYKEKKQVATAYAEQRTTLMRYTSVTYAPYRPLEKTMGSNSIEDKRNRRALLKAEGMIGDHGHAGTKLDSEWLQMDARLALIEDPDDAGVAVKILGEAQAKGLDDIKLELDLAVAYFEKDLHSKSEAPGPNPHPPQPEKKAPDLSRSITLLNKVLNNSRLNKDQKSVALFNLAIAYEESNMPDLAVPTWDKYLEIDSTSPWSTEARERREKSRQRIQNLKQQGCAEFGAPAFFLSSVSNPVVQQNLEECLDLALTGWLPEAIRDPGGDFGRAARKLASLFAEGGHLDPWFRDFLQQLRSGDLPAVSALNEAVKLNAGGRNSDALPYAQNAYRYFAQHHNAPGEDLALFEQVYAYQRVENGHDCLNGADQLGRMLERSSYHWLQAQTYLEKAVCRPYTGDMSEIRIEADLDQGLQIARNFQLPISLFRILGIAPGIRRQLSGKCGRSWSQEIQGLGDYWQGTYPAERLYQFYAVLAQCAAQEGAWNAAKPLLLRSIAIREEIIEPVHPDPLILGADYVTLAGFLTSLKEDAAAEAAAMRAEVLFARVPPGPAVTHFKLAAKITLAECQSNLGKAQRALETISPAEVLITPATDKLLVLDFRRVKGTILRQLRQMDNAEAQYKLGIEMAEADLSTITGAENRLNWTAKTEELYQGLVRVWLEQNRVDDAWRLWEWSRTRSLSENQDKRPMPEATWRDIERKILSIRVPQSRHVVYASFKDRLHVWIVSGEGIHAQWIDVDRSELTSLSQRFGSQCADKTSRLQEVHERGRKLFHLLIEPALGKLGKSGAIAFELDLPMQNLPLQALRSPEGWYLIQRYAVIYSPGVLMERKLRMPGYIQSSDSLLLINAIPHLTLTPASKAMVWEPRIASPAEMVRAFGRSDAAIFFGHGLRTGAGTILMLTPTMSVTSEAFAAQNFPRLRLAVLAACSSGSAEEYGLLDTGSLVHVLLAGRVSNVIASNWDVHDESTMKLVVSFSRFIDGEEAASAMSKAEIDFLHTSDPEHQHPYYWAGLNVYGRPGLN